MPEQITGSAYFLVAMPLIIVGVVLVFSGIVALIRARISAFTTQILLALLLLSLGFVIGMIGSGIQGYKALTREEFVAKISVTPIAPQRMGATFHYADGRKANFIIAGDEIVIDAHILKWQPWANLLGLHTAYELDRVSGRYHDINQERTAERTIHLLSEDKRINLFGLRQRHAFLALLLDAKYGSAAFIPVDHTEDIELRISTTGLLMREVQPTLK